MKTTLDDLHGAARREEVVNRGPGVQAAVGGDDRRDGDGGTAVHGRPPSAAMAAAFS